SRTLSPRRNRPCRLHPTDVRDQPHAEHLAQLGDELRERKPDGVFVRAQTRSLIRTDGDSHGHSVLRNTSDMHSETAPINAHPLAGSPADPQELPISSVSKRIGCETPRLRDSPS